VRARGTDIAGNVGHSEPREVYVGNPPAADAGLDQIVDPGALVTLDGSGSHDANGDPITYGWRQISGEGVVLSAPSAVTPTFLAPLAPGPLTFSLTVTDSWGLTDHDTTVVLVRYPIPVGGATLGGAWPGAPGQGAALLTLALAVLVIVAGAAVVRRLL